MTRASLASTGNISATVYLEVRSSGSLYISMRIFQLEVSLNVVGSCYACALSHAYYRYRQADSELAIFRRVEPVLEDSESSGTDKTISSIMLRQVCLTYVLILSRPSLV